ncbi:MAG: hypothetical protein JKX81_14650 [Arenicella sp.]|nr:hypothetical protein [Arenicella sp.]
MSYKKDSMSNRRQGISDDVKYLDELNWDIQPERDLWPDVHSNIRFAGKPELVVKPSTLDAQKSAVQRLWMPMSMAACMMLALGAFVMSSMSFQRAQDTYQLQASYIDYQKSQISLIEQQHAHVRAQFTTLLSGELGTINPATVAEVQAVLLTIDSASMELKSAILAQPTNANYASMLARTYQQELRLLNKFKTANGMSI